jgi:transcriptional regulator with XRE-family HTH domain
MRIVSSKLKLLLQRLLAATSQRGKKVELARFVGVPQPRVSEWLSGFHEPGAEVTLHLLEWVQVEEAKQQQTGAMLITPRRPKTRKLNPLSHEKSKRVRKRK